MSSDTDVIIVGAGLAGLVAATEFVEAGRRVIVLDQEPEASLGGQVFWSFGGLFFVNSPEQRRLRIRDSHELAWQDWLASAGFDRDEDHWPLCWLLLISSENKASFPLRLPRHLTPNGHRKFRKGEDPCS